MLAGCLDEGEGFGSAFSARRKAVAGSVDRFSKEIGSASSLS